MFFKYRLYCQNLIQNPSFETFTNPIGCAGGFYNTTLFPMPHVVNNWEQFNSPDYFNTVCGNTAWYTVPDNRFGNVPAKQGNAYVGFTAYQVGTQFKEYVYQNLITPLQAGKNYCLSFWVSRADKKEYAIKQLGAYFSNNIPNLINGYYINATPQIVNQNGFITDTIGWQQINGCFTANGGEQYITFGNFNTNINTDTIYAGTNNPVQNDPLYAYYYLDDISLTDNATVGLNELNALIDDFKIFPNPSNGIITLNCSQNKHYTLQIKNTLGQLIRQVVIFEEKTSLDISNEVNGVYFCQLFKDKKVIKSEKIIIIN